MTPRPLSEPVRSHDDLLAVFFEAMKPKEEFRIGAEMEKFGVYEVNGDAVPYKGPRGVVRLLQFLQENHGWAPESEYEGGPVIALRRGVASVTLEPGAQLELSGSPLATVHEVDAELREHLRELEPISRELGVVWLGLGFHPFARRDDLDWVPKLRYGIMRKYLPTRGELALDMMLRTSTVQANYDFSSEDDAMRKMQVALRLSPLTTAMFANSPFYEGSLFAGKSFRANVWTDVDPDRSGLVPALWGEHPRLVDYVEWALDAPMFMFKRDGKSMDNTGQTFRSFWKDGFRGHKPTQGDWQTHLNTLFPDVRLKKTIEVRGADAQRSTLAPALPALFAGILYDAKALEQAWSLVESFRVEDLQQLRGRIWKNSLQTPFGQGTLTDLASKVIEIAEGGLARRAHLDASGRDERVHLAELKALAAQGRCPADALLDKVAPKGKAPENVAEFRRVVIEASTLTAS